MRLLRRRPDPAPPVWVLSKSSKPHLLVMPANCGNPGCACQDIDPPEVSR